MSFNMSCLTLVAFIHNTMIGGSDGGGGGGGGMNGGGLRLYSFLLII